MAGEPSKKLSALESFSLQATQEVDDRWAEFLEENAGPDIKDDDDDVAEGEEGKQQGKKRGDRKRPRAGHAAGGVGASKPKPSATANSQKAAATKDPQQPTLMEAMSGGRHGNQSGGVTSDNFVGDRRLQELLQAGEEDDAPVIRPAAGARAFSSTKVKTEEDASSSDDDFDLEAFRQMQALGDTQSQSFAGVTSHHVDPTPFPVAPPAARQDENDNMPGELPPPPTTEASVVGGKSSAKGKAAKTAAGAKPDATPTVNYAVKTVNLKNAPQDLLPVNVGSDVAGKGTAKDPALSAIEQLSSLKGTAGQLFYWLDAKERDSMQVTDPGTVILIGKAYNDEKKAFESCAVKVKGMMRCVMIVGDPAASQEQVIKSIAIMCSKQGIRERRVKVVKRWYAFEVPDLPQGCSFWYKLRYPASDPPLNVNLALNGDYPAIRSICGSNRSLIELLLLKRRFQGPSYLRLEGSSLIKEESKKLTHCAVEYEVDSPKKVLVLTNTNLPVPPLTALSLHVDAQLDASGKHNEIHSISMVFNEKVSADGRSMAGSEVPFHNRMVGIRQFTPHNPFPMELAGYCAKRKLLEGLHSQVKVFPTEDKLLEWMLAVIREKDPDLLVGHNFMAYTLDIVLHRLAHRPALPWSLLGRFKIAKMPVLQAGVGGTREATYEERQICCGRLVADSYLTAKEHHRTTSYKVAELCKGLGVNGIFGPVTDDQIDLRRLPYKEGMNVEELYFSLASAINVATMSLGIIFRLDIIPLTKRLSSVAGNLWARTLNGSRSERIEYLLLHAFHEKKFVTPDKKSLHSSGTVSGRPMLSGRKTVREKEDELLDFDPDQQREAEEEKKEREAKGGKAEEVGDDGGADDGAGDGVDGEGGNGGKNQQSSASKKTRYMGGKVLEPIRGLYTDFVLLLDFNSLYPSIIQEFNICFTTVDRIGKASVADGVTLPSEDNLVCSECKGDASYGPSNPCPHRCILPRVISGLVTQRREVKKLMKTEKDPALLAQYDIRQKALKLTANSMYGCLGFEFSRFFAQPLAELVTMQGRQALTNAVELVPSASDKHILRVVYGDTDSVMVQTGIKDDLKEAREIAEDIKRSVNKRYKSLEIDIDGIFRSLLLVRKKKYAAVTIIDWAGEGKILKQETKGLDLVRRDWCPLSKKLGEEMVTRLLRSDQDADELIRFISERMGEVAKQCREGKIALEEYAITKSITKDPKLYHDAPPHVAVALRMIQNNQPVLVGDLIPYVICVQQISAEQSGAAEKKGSQNVKGLSARALHVDECREQARAIDVEWYLETQILPPIERLCQHLPGFTSTQLSDAMGVMRPQQAANLEGGADGISSGIRQSGRDGAGYASYKSAFKVQDLECLESVFQVDEAIQTLQLKCKGCLTVTTVQPHLRCQEILQGSLVRHRDDEAVAERIREAIRKRHLHSARSSGGSGAVGLDDSPQGQQMYPDDPESMNCVWVYRCHQCGKHVSLGMVTNLVIFAVRHAQRRFYDEGGSALGRKRLRAQLSYLRALLSEPNYPGVPRNIKETHRRVLRGTLAFDDGEVIPCSSYTGGKYQNLYSNLPLEFASQMYNQLDGLFIDVTKLCI